jgi:long-subunit acyl-CoA synthetase (AMP-forming)
VCDPKFYNLVADLGPTVVSYTYQEGVTTNSEAKGWTDGDALIVYTSGTTGKPKGVVHTHKSVEAALSSLETAWQWHPSDKILNVLPMHHVHGIVNILNSSLWAGADCHLHSNRFNA